MTREARDRASRWVLRCWVASSDSRGGKEERMRDSESGVSARRTDGQGAGAETHWAGVLARHRFQLSGGAILTFPCLP